MLMGGSLRWRLVKLALFCLMMAILWTSTGEFGWMVHIKTMDSGRYIKEEIKGAWGPAQEKKPWNGKVSDKIVVMSHMEKEDVSWVERELPDWQRKIYRAPSEPKSSPQARADDAEPMLPANKGHEVLGYLTYLIDNYDSLPSTIAFIHPHEKGYKESWHVDAPMHSNPVALRSLNLKLIENEGYANLRCNPQPNCVFNGEGSRHPKLLTRELWKTFWSNTSTPADKMEEELKKHRINHDYPRHHGNWWAWIVNGFKTDQAGDHSLPRLGHPAGAQFAVSKERVRERPQTDYVALREWVLNSDEDDKVSGRVFEYLWHVIFGMPGVLCYRRAMCECDTFGRC